MKPQKPTKDVRQAWLLAGLVLFFVLLFAFVLLPYIDPAKRTPDRLPEFELPVIHGGERGSHIRLSDLRGTVVVLDFWASWCSPCKKQMPILNRVASEFGDAEALFIGVNTDEQRAQALEFLRTRPVSYPSVFDVGHAASFEFGVTRLPTLVVLDARGQVVARESRVLSERSIRELVSSAQETSL